ncbi:MAG: Rrf2 family transcriptional regulator [Planctomycetota bacterium]|nr:MAG: Rrf2 family transcriptional regulator [Planctomycetota bacterium]REJ95840.1 MAG: Rrf2 family transcriptional regulator [Planctomycetota bacterium]REK25547.1 MAG: Rrf2 family transcriptional regulator [Planctomycetota bacterium]REK31741.1 MAG: Rrf2 family transcriptional regulator [Planctomycetota bacterium]
MISQSVEYALRAIVTLAQQEGEPCTAKVIAQITRVPEAYLAKLMQGLARAGLVNSQRGLHGGFTLNRDPHDLTIWNIVEIVDPIRRIHECPLGIESHGTTLCPLHRRLDEAIQGVETTFRETTVSELLAPAGSVAPLCEETKVFSLDGRTGRVRSRKRSTSK